MDRATNVFQRIKGPVVAINVCFDEDGRPDYAAVGRYVDWLCQQPTTVLLLTYGSSEFSGMTEEEIYRLTAEVGKANAGRLLFIASSGWWPPTKCGEFLRHADQVGADAVKVQIHPWLGKDRDTILRYYDLIQTASDIPLLAWGHSPPPLPVAVAAELAKRPNVVGMKNDGDPFYDYYDLIRSTRDDNFAVISGGQMRNFLFGYQIGSPAYLCTVAPFHPDVANQFHNLVTGHRYDEAWQMVYRYEEPWLKLAIEMGWLQSIKSVLFTLGLYPNNLLHSPSRSHGPEEVKRVRAMIEEIFGPMGKSALP